MTMGMKAAGDNPLGWRVAAALCGALTLAAVYLWALLLLRDSRLASFAAGLTLFKFSLRDVARRHDGCVLDGLPDVEFSGVQRCDCTRSQCRPAKVSFLLLWCFDRAGW